MLIETTEKAATTVRAHSELQDRVLQALEMASSVSLEQHAGSPDMVPEIERELTMLEGALQGVYQRVGEVVAACESVLTTRALNAICEEQPARPPSEDAFAIETSLGRRLRELQYRLTEIEHALSYLGNGIRL